MGVRGYLPVALFFALVVACGSAAPIEDSSAAPASADGGVEEGDADAGYEMRGAYRCCNEGTGTSCCAGVSRTTCDQYGGVYGHCIGEGESYEGKTICAKCCDGLIRGSADVLGTRQPPEVDGLRDGCDLAGTPSTIVCLRCGDGVCGIGETYCNCPLDCPPP